MADAEVKLKITADTAELDKKIDESQQKIDGGDGAQNVSPTMGKMEEAKGALQQTAGILKQANAELQENATLTKLVAEAQQACEKTAQALGNAISLLQGHFYEVNREIDKGGGVFENFQELPALFQEAIGPLQKLNELVQSGKWPELTAAVQSAAASYQELGTHLQTVGTGMREVGKAGETADLTKLHDLLAELLEVTKKNAEADTKAAKQKKEAARAEVAASTESAEAAEKERYKKDLLTMSIKQLKDELLKQANAQREAAAAGDTEAQKVAEQRYKAVNSQLRQMNRTRQAGIVAMAQEAQAGKQLVQSVSTLGKSLGSLSQDLKNGTLDADGLSSSLMSLAQLGPMAATPVGLLSIAVSAGAAAWNLYAQAQKRSLEIAREQKKFEDEYRAARRDANIQTINAERKAELQATIERVNGYAKATAERLQLESAAANSRAASELAAADEVDRHRKAQIQQELATANAATRQRLLREQNEIDRKARERRAKDARDAANAAKEQADAMAAELNKPELKKFLQIKLPDKEEYNKLKADIASAENAGNKVLLKQLTERLDEMGEERHQFVKDVAALDKTFAGSFDDAYTLVEGIRNGRRETEKMVAEFRKQADAAEKAAEAAEKKAKHENDEARAAAARREANARLDEGRAKILKATKTTGSYSERDTRTQYDILRSDRAILQARLVALQNELEVAKASGADAEKVKSLTEDITALKKSIRGAGQQIDDAVPALVQSLREGIKPGALVALNPANQAEVDRVAAAMSGYGKELEELYRKMADAEKKRGTSTIAEDNVEKYREKIAKVYKKLGADAEGINARVVGGTGGTEFFKQIDAAAKATVDALNEATRKQQERNAAGYEERQQAAQEAITAELERRAALLAQQNNAMEAVLTGAGQQGGTADAMGRVLGASERMLQYLQSQQSALVAAQGRIARLEAKLNALGPKITNLTR